MKNIAIAILMLGGIWTSANAQLVIEGIQDTDETSRIVGTFTIPNSNRSHGSGQALGPYFKGDTLFYNKVFSDDFVTAFGLNSAEIRFLNRRDISGSRQELSNASITQVHPTYQTMDIGGVLYRDTLVGSSIDTVALSLFDGGGEIVVGRVDSADVTESLIRIDHRISISPVDKAKLRSITGETLVKVEYDGGELELVVEDISIGEVTGLIPIGAGASPTTLIERIDGSIVTAEVGTRIFEGDLISTGEGLVSTVIRFADGSLFRFTSGSRARVLKKTRKRDATPMQLLTGTIRALVQNPQKNSTYKFLIKIKNAVLGVRGTEFEIGIVENGSNAEITTSVDEGLVDFINEETGELFEVSSGETHTITQSLDYPNDISNAHSLRLNSSLVTSLLSEEDVDFFRFEVTKQGLVTIESSGDTDTIAAIFSAPILEEEYLIADDDDGAGNGFNFKISQELLPGVYYLGVEGFESGDYNLIIKQEGSYSYEAFQVGLIGRETAPNLDPFERGISNGLAYAFGIPLEGNLSEVHRSLLPRIAQSRFGKVSAVSFRLPSATPEDVIYKVLASESLSGSWEEIARRSAGSWSGTLSDKITVGSESESSIPLTFEYPDDYQSRGFMRLEITIEE